MNDEQNNNVMGTVDSSIPVDNPTPSIVPNVQEEMTTAVVNPNFMAEVEPEVAPAIDPNPVVEAPINVQPENPAPAPSEPVNLEPEKKKKGINKIVLIIVIVLAVIIVAVGAYAGYLFVGVKPQKVHDKVIDQMFAKADKFANQLSVNSNPDAKTMKAISNITFNTNMEELSMLKDYSLKLDCGIDKVGKYANYKLTFLEKSKELLDMNYYILDNKMYLDSKDLYNDVIVIGDYEIDASDLIDSYDAINGENLSYLLEVLKKGFKDSLDEGKYERNLEDVKINGKTIKAFNNSYVIDEATYYSMMKTIFTTFRNDDKAIEILADMITYVNSNMVLEGSYNVVYDEQDDNITKEDIKTLLDNAIKAYSDPELSGSSDKIYFNVYTSMITNSVVGVKLISKDSTGSFTLIDYAVDGDVSKLIISADNEDTFVFEVSTKGDTSEFKLSVLKQTLFSGTLVSSDNKFELTINMDLETLSGTPGLPKLTLILSSESSDNKSLIELKAVVEQSNQKYDLGLRIDTEYKYDEQITKPSVSKAIDIEKVDEDKLSKNLLKSLEGSNLYDVLSAYMDSMNVIDDPKSDVIEYSEHCDEARNCKCSGVVCNCRYLNDDWDYEDIVCPNPNN